MGPAATGRVPAPGQLPIDPRFARRWTQVRREQGRRRLRIVAVLAAVVVVVGAAAVSLYSPWLSMRQVRVTTVGAVSRAEVLSVAGLNHRRPLIAVDTGAAAARLDAVPTLGGARVSRSWPSTIEVRVIQRTPVAVVARAAAPGAAAEWATVDATGRILADSVAPLPGLPVLQGVGQVPAVGDWLIGTAGPRVDPPPPPPAGGAAANGPSLVDLNAESDTPSVPNPTAAAVAIAAALPASVRSAVVTVRIGPGNQLTLAVLPFSIAAGSIPVTLGDGSQLGAKLTALAALLANANLSGAAGINLTVPDRPAVLTARQTPDTVSTLAVG